MSKSLGVLVAIALAAPSMAVAGPYIGIGIGGTRTESSLTELGLFPGPELPLPEDPADPDPNFTGSDDFTSTDVSLDVAVGWNFGMFGVELGYTDFGKAEQHYDLPPTCTTQGCGSREWTATMELAGVRAFVTGTLPLSDSVDVYAKLGALYWEADYAGLERNEAFIPGPGPPIGPRYDETTFDDDDTALAGAIGVNLKTDSPFSLRAELAYFDVDTTDKVWNAQLMGVYTF